MGDGRKVYVFGLASAYRRKFEASGKFRLCLCKDLFQLYESRGKEFTKDDVAGSTFVYLKAEGQDFDCVKGDGKGRKGKRAKAGSMQDAPTGLTSQIFRSNNNNTCEACDQKAYRHRIFSYTQE